MKRPPNSVSLTLADLAERVGGEVAGNSEVVISGAAPIQTATERDISFVANVRYAKYLATTRAGAVVLDLTTECSRLPVLRHQRPYLAFALILDELYPDVGQLAPGIHATAMIEEGATVDPTAAIGPFCHVRSGATIGSGSQLVSAVFIGRDVAIGDNCLLYPGVQVMDGCRLGSGIIVHSSTVIGSDGFGFAESDQGLKKIKQVGWVEIEDDVEIGSNTSIDRGALGPTKIGRGTKIDNLVQIAHNVEIGRHCVIVSQVGISGSTKIGDGVMLGGQVGIVGHLEIGDKVRIGAQSGVAKSVPAGQTFFGSPARDIMLAKRIDAALTRLPELLHRVRKLEEKLKP
ncbi:MAG TPA: UDP-3-O-(3-hydroxymyristoyl)glucosamine N-acyltransferase [Candidatus Deferrimicrobium sp.]|nr:UDP-3-O-(3-hydroxymyristoyl)glucosamine N-acyltransferase [Candidatus Deferrimicrobium sp.]